MPRKPKPQPDKRQYPPEVSPPSPETPMAPHPIETPPDAPPVTQAPVPPPSPLPSPRPAFETLWYGQGPRHWMIQGKPYGQPDSTRPDVGMPLLVLVHPQAELEGEASKANLQSLALVANQWGWMTLQPALTDAALHGFMDLEALLRYAWAHKQDWGWDHLILAGFGPTAASQVLMAVCDPGLALPHAVALFGVPDAFHGDLDARPAPERAQCPLLVAVGDPDQAAGRAVAEQAFAAGWPTRFRYHAGLTTAQAGRFDLNAPTATQLRALW